MRKLPDVKVLLKRYYYDPETGLVKSKRTGRLISCKVRGYLVTGINGMTSVGLHRIIWKMMTGVDPVGKVVDHINGNTLDNRWSNLRLVTSEQNRLNTRGLGITKHGTNRWRSQISVDGQSRYIGVYDCPLIARIAYEDKCRELRGEFSPV